MIEIAFNTVTLMYLKLNQFIITWDQNTWNDELEMKTSLQIYKKKDFGAREEEMYDSRPCCCLSTLMTLARGGSPIFPLVVSTSQQCSHSRCCVCECYRGGIMVMDVIWHRLCVNMI